MNMTDFEIAIQRLENLALKPATPKAVSGDLSLVLGAAKALATSTARIAELEEQVETLTEEKSDAFGYARDMEAAVELNDEEQEAELTTLRQQLAEAKAVVEKLRDALLHIAEYWNRSENDKAMSDALYHMIDTAEAALAAQKGGGE